MVITSRFSLPAMTRMRNIDSVAIVGEDTLLFVAIRNAGPLVAAVGASLLFYSPIPVLLQEHEVL